MTIAEIIRVLHTCDQTMQVMVQEDNNNSGYSTISLTAHGDGFWNTLIAKHDEPDALYD